MKYTTCRRFPILLIALIFILNINISFAAIHNYFYFSLSEDTEKKGYKIIGVKKIRNNLWKMSGTKDHLFSIMDKAGENSVIIKTEGKDRLNCTSVYINKRDNKPICLNYTLIWEAHIVAIKSSKGKGLNIQGCGATSKIFRLQSDGSPYCKLSIIDDK